MDGVGVYCSWEMLGRPSTITCTTTLLGKGPSLLQGSWWCVLRVRSSCLSTERLWAGLPAGESLGAIGLSVIPGWTTPSCTVVPSHSSALLFLYSLPPLFHELGPVSPPHSPSSILLPSLPLFVFCPFTPVTLPSLLFLGFPLRVTARFSTLSFHHRVK